MSFRFAERYAHKLSPKILFDFMMKFIKSHVCVKVKLWSVTQKCVREISNQGQFFSRKHVRISKLTATENTFFIIQLCFCIHSCFYTEFN